MGNGMEMDVRNAAIVSVYQPNQPSIFGVVQSNEYTLLIHITKHKWGNGIG